MSGEVARTKIHFFCFEDKDKQLSPNYRYGSTPQSKNSKTFNLIRHIGGVAGIRSSGPRFLYDHRSCVDLRLSVETGSC